jgi:hypothetical protein
VFDEPRRVLPREEAECTELLSNPFDLFRFLSFKLILFLLVDSKTNKGWISGRSSPALICSLDKYLRSFSGDSKSIRAGISPKEELFCCLVASSLVSKSISSHDGILLVLKAAEYVEIP